MDPFSSRIKNQDSRLSRLSQHFIVRCFCAWFSFIGFMRSHASSTIIIIVANSLKFRLHFTVTSPSLSNVVARCCCCCRWKPCNFFISPFLCKTKVLQPSTCPESNAESDSDSDLWVTSGTSSKRNQWSGEFLIPIQKWMKIQMTERVSFSPCWLSRIFYAMYSAMYGMREKKQVNLESILFRLTGDWYSYSYAYSNTWWRWHLTWFGFWILDRAARILNLEA